MYLDKKQVKVIRTAISVMNAILANGLAEEDYEEISEATDVLFDIIKETKVLEIC